VTTRRRTIIAGAAVALVVALVLVRVVSAGPEPNSLSLGEFRARLDTDVTEVVLLDTDHKIEGVFDNGREFEVRYPAGYTARITQQIVDADVPDFRVDSQQEGEWVSLLLNLLPILIVVALVLYFLNRSQGGGRVMSFGKAKTKSFSKDEP